MICDNRTEINPTMGDLIKRQGIIFFFFFFFFLKTGDNSVLLNDKSVKWYVPLFCAYTMYQYYSGLKKNYYLGQQT